MLGDVGIAELAIILVVVLVIFGPSRLTDVMSGMGKGIREFRKAVRDEETPDKPDQVKPS